MRQNQGDRLRMLGKDELGELLRVGFLERRETGVGVERLDDAIENPARLVRPDRFRQEPSRVFDAARRDIFRGGRQLMELVEDLLAQRRPAPDAP